MKKRLLNEVKFPAYVFYIINNFNVTMLTITLSYAEALRSHQSLVWFTYRHSGVFVDIPVYLSIFSTQPLNLFSLHALHL